MREPWTPPASEPRPPVDYAPVVPRLGILLEVTPTGGVRASLRCDGRGPGDDDPPPHWLRQAWDATMHWLGLGLYFAVLATLLTLAMWNPLFGRLVHQQPYERPPVWYRLLMIAVVAAAAYPLYGGPGDPTGPTVIEWDGPDDYVITVTIPRTRRTAVRRFDARRFATARVICRRDGDEYPYVLQLIPLAADQKPVDLLTSADGYAPRALARAARRAFLPPLAWHRRAAATAREGSTGNSPVR